jgi:hypothetical protein
MQFEKYRAELSDTIMNVINPQCKKDDYGDLYKYFLETEATDVNDRIHYFSSFYYMLAELALFSGFAAFFLTFLDLSLLAGHIHPDLAILAKAMITMGILVHIAILHPLTAVKRSRTQYTLIVALLMVSAGMFLLTYACWRAGLIGIKFAFQGVRWEPLLLLGVGYLFQRLADKTWKQIIREQMVLVHHRKYKLIQAAAIFEPRY